MTISNLPFPYLGAGNKIGRSKPIRYTLPDRLTLCEGHNCYFVPPGTEVILMTGTNFGLCVVPAEQSAPWGQRVFRY